MDEIENLYHLFDSQKKDLLRLVQNGSKPLGPEEVHYFLTSMDKIFSHGLKNEKLGYWPFVQEFTHKAGVSYIADMKNCVTGPGKSRAWLLLALSEGTLEFYFTSFVAHVAQRARHYRRGAFLRDERRLKQLVLGLAELMTAEINTVLRPEEYDLDKHVCPPPNASEAGEFSSWESASPWWPAAQSPEPLQWTHTGGGRSARRSAHSSSGSSPRSSRSSARSRRRRRCSPAGGGGGGGETRGDKETREKEAPGEKDTRRDSDAPPTDSACVTMDSAASSSVTTPLSERTASPPPPGSSPESAQSAASAELGDGIPRETGTVEMAMGAGGQRCEESGTLTGSDTPTPTPGSPAVRASSPIGQSLRSPPPPVAVAFDDAPSPIAPAVRPAERPAEKPAERHANDPAERRSEVFTEPHAVGHVLQSEMTPVPRAPVSAQPPVGLRDGGVGSRITSITDAARADTGACEEGDFSESGAAVTGQREAPSGGCTPLESAPATVSVTGNSEAASASVKRSSPRLGESEESSGARLSQPTSANPTQAVSPSGAHSRESNANGSSAPAPAVEDTSRDGFDASDPRSATTTAAAPPRDRPLSPVSPPVDPRRVSSGDALAVTEAMRRLRADGAALARPPVRASTAAAGAAGMAAGGPHLPPSASSGALRTRPAAAAVGRLPQAHSEVTLRRRPPPMAPDKRVTWSGTDRETAAVAALLPPGPPRGERGVPEGQEDPARLSSVSSLTRVSSQLSVGSSCLSSDSTRSTTARPAARQTRLYEPTALCPTPAPSDGRTEQEIARELSQGRRSRRAAHSALVEIDHCKAVQLMVSFFEGDEMAYTGFKVLFGDHHAMRTCLLVLTSYRLLLLRASTYRRLRRAARRRPRPADPLAQLTPGGGGVKAGEKEEKAETEAEAESCPYFQDAAFHYCSIASIKVAFHGQALALQRPDGSYSRWIWLGDRADTALLISHVTRAVQRCRLRPPPPQVYTSDAHRQQYMREIGYRETKPEIRYASLVYFEDFAVPGETPKLSDQLMYMTHAEPRWAVGHFVLWDTDLLVYPSASAARGGGAPLERWPLAAMASCRRLTELSRPHQLQLAAPGRWLTLAAADAETCSRWAQIVREVIELSTPSQLPSPRPRCCVLTSRALYVIEEMAFTRGVAPGFELCPYGHLVQASGQLRVLGAVNADSHGTVHLEFDTAEAAESTGSWRLYFVTLTEQRAFLTALIDTYRQRCKRELTVGQISHHMREVCLSGSRYVRTRWDDLVDT